MSAQIDCMGGVGAMAICCAILVTQMQVIFLMSDKTFMLQHFLR